jgi:hypothetical protein
MDDTIYCALVSLPLHGSGMLTFPKPGGGEVSCRTLICSPSEENGFWNNASQDHANNEDGKVGNTNNSIEGCIEASWLGGSDNVV